LLVGFMGSGKSTVGSVLARHLGWRFADVDANVERTQSMPVSQVFSRLGEARFREREDAATPALLREADVVVASGGGWAARAGRLDELPSGTIAVWLVVGVEEAVRRVGAQPGKRPLLEGADPLAAARELLSIRTPMYARATHEVDTEGLSVEDVSILVMRTLGLNAAVADTKTDTE
jgi:shikimate kinase